MKLPRSIVTLVILVGLLGFATIGAGLATDHGDTSNQISAPTNLLDTAAPALPLRISHSLTATTTEAMAREPEQMAASIAAEIMEEMASHEGSLIIEEMTTSKAVSMMSAMDVGEAAEMWSLVEKVKAGAILEQVPTEVAGKIIWMVPEDSLIDRLPEMSATRL